MICIEDQKKITDRISRIEGLVGGIRHMIEADRDCFQVLKQIAAASGALRSLGMVILEDHLKGCVSDAIRTKTNENELVGQVVEIFHKFAR